jgi:hypothetical protein
VQITNSHGTKPGHRFSPCHRLYPPELGVIVCHLMDDKAATLPGREVMTFVIH